MSNFSNEKLVAKNTLYNIVGYSVPLIFAIFLIPSLIKNLGVERFGILSLIWIIIGYSSFLDFGISRALTKVIAEKINLNTKVDIPGIFWTSLFTILIVTIIISVGISTFLPSILSNKIQLSPINKADAYESFDLVIFSLPLITSAAVLKGFLEAYQMFKVINVIRIIMGISSFTVPLIVIYFLNSLYWIVFTLLIVRIIIWIIYFLVSLKANHNLFNDMNFKLKHLIPLLNFGFWISIANLIGPIILYSDRFLIGILISATAIGYYTTPYEMITKVLVIPTSLVTVLFPVFASNFISNPKFSIQLFYRAERFNYLIVFPIILFVVTFAELIMTLWIGYDFAILSFQILQFLSIGILMNSFSLIPNTYFQSSGKPKVPTLINLTQLPFYLLMMWVTIRLWGIKGAALTYLLMAAIDAIVMNFLATKYFSFRRTQRHWIVLLLSLLILLLSFFLQTLTVRIVFYLLFIIFFFYMSWKHFLLHEEKVVVRLKVQKVLKTIY